MAENLNKPLKKYEENSINNFKKMMLNDHKINDIKKINKEMIHKYIIEAKKQNTKDYSLSWKKTLLFSLASYFKINNMMKEQMYMMIKAKEINKKINVIEEEQEQTKNEKENYLNYYEIRNYFDKYKNYKHIDDMYNYLLLACLCTDQEPLRPQIYINAHYVDELKKIKNDDKNYIYISKQGKSGHFYINNDKVDKHTEHKEHKRIRLNKEFLKIVVKSFKDYPRTKMFNFDVKQTGNKLLNMFHQITKTNFNFQMARSSFITYKNLENPNMSYKQKKALALNMRHSKQTQEKNYCKHNLTLTNKTLQELKDDANNKYIVLKDTEKKLNDNVDKLNELKIKNDKYEKHNININNDNENVTQRLLLIIMKIEAINKSYKDQLHETNDIINKYNENIKKVSIDEIFKNFKDNEKLQLIGNYQFDSMILTTIENKLKKHNYNDKFKKINLLTTTIIFEDNYDHVKLNEEVYNILYDEDNNNEDENHIVKEQNTPKYKKNRKDIIYSANKNKTKENNTITPYKKIKGVISAKNLYKYNIIFNEEKNKYE
jgi:hypothetical protein